MLESITIKNFKAIGDTPLELKDLTNVNYLVGKNGCGKSSVLEALESVEIRNNNEINKKIDCRVINDETFVMILIEVLPFDFDSDITKYVELNEIFKSLGENKALIFNKINYVINRLKNTHLLLINKNNKLYLPYYIIGETVGNITNLIEKQGGPDLFSNRWEFETNSYKQSEFDNYIQIIIDDIKENDNIDITNFINAVKSQLKRHLNEFFHDYSKGFDRDFNKTTKFVDSSIKILNYNNLELNLIDGNSPLVKENRLYLLNLLIDIGNFKPPSDNLIYADNNILIFDDEKNTSISTNTLSSGQKVIIKLYFLLKIRLNTITIVIFDEPETSLHPEVQKMLPTLFASFPNIQFFVATHSPFIINAALELENQKVYHISNGECTNPDGFDKNTLNSNIAGIHGDLGMLPQDLFFANCLIWVEGPTDAIYIHFWLQKYLSENKLKLTKGIDYEFCLFGGACANNFYLLEDDYEFVYDEKSDNSKIFDLLKVHPRSFVVVDNDEGELLKIPVKKGVSGFEEFKQKIIREFDESKYWYDSTPDNFTIESYIKKSKKTKEVEYKSKTKKEFALKYCGDNKDTKLDDCLTPEGQSMIQKLYEFIKNSNS